MQIKIESAIAHICNSVDLAPVLSNVPLELSMDFQDYLCRSIEKTFTSDDIKSCSFQPDSLFKEQCRNTHWDLVPLSVWATEEIFRVMHQNGEIPAGDLFFGIAHIDDGQYFFMLKYDYKTAFTHFVESAPTGVSVNMIQHQAVLPTMPPKINEGFFLDMNAPTVKLMEHKYSIDGEKAFYLSTRILDCTEAESPRQKTNKLLRVAEKVADTYYNNPDEVSLHINTTMCEEFETGQPLSVQKLGKRFFEDNEEAQNEFFAKLDSARITRDEELNLSEQYQKKFQKQTLNTAAGVEIIIPTQLYGNTNEVEFINNPDGSVSLLIKNVKM